MRALLFGLAVFDTLLVIWVFAFPDLWFQAFYGVERIDPQRLLQRMGANWSAFALLQWLAAFRWRSWPQWLLVIAGVRLSDMFTDVTNAIACRDATWFAWVTLPPMSLLNLLIGVWLIKTWSAVDARVTRAA